MTGSPPPADGVKEAYAPRRKVLDILVRAEVEAGAELRTGFSVEEVMWDNNRVVGIRGREEGSSAIAEEARIVVGADGINSMAARAVHLLNTIPNHHCKDPTFRTG